jgi:hypothetical protein
VLQQPVDEPVAVRLMAFAVAVVPVVVASGLAYKHASGSSLNYSLYKVSATHSSSSSSVKFALLRLSARIHSTEARPYA